MAQRRRPRRREKSKRHWRIPPPALRDGDAPGPEGLLILEEMEGALGLALWKSLRSVLLWSLSDPAARGDLFDSGAAKRRASEFEVALGDGAHPLDEAVAQLVRLLKDPVEIEAEALAEACTQVAEWAEGEHHSATSLEFRQAAALVAPTDPRLALAMMRAARDQARYGRAEAWFHRAMGLARRSKDWDAYVRAYLEHGTMMRRRGAFPAARRSYLKALRRSTRQGLTEVRATTLHEFHLLERYAGEEEAALRHARQAVDILGAGHPRLATLAADLASGWLDDGDAEAAIAVLEAAYPLLPGAARAMALGSMARGAGILGNSERFDQARRELHRTPPGPGVAEAWVEVARGAAHLKRDDDALEAARRAEDLTRELHDGQVRLGALSLVSDLLGRKKAARAKTGGDEVHALRAGVADHLVQLLEEGAARQARRRARRGRTSRSASPSKRNR